MCDIIDIADVNKAIIWTKCEKVFFYESNIIRYYWLWKTQFDEFSHGEKTPRVDSFFLFHAKQTKWECFASLLGNKQIFTNYIPNYVFYLWLFVLRMRAQSKHSLFLTRVVYHFPVTAMKMKTIFGFIYPTSLSCN